MGKKVYISEVYNGVCEAYTLYMKYKETDEGTHFVAIERTHCDNIYAFVPEEIKIKKYIDYHDSILFDTIPVDPYKFASFTD